MKLPDFETMVHYVTFIRESEFEALDSAVEFIKKFHPGPGYEIEIRVTRNNDTGLYHATAPMGHLPSLIKSYYEIIQNDYQI